MEIYVYIHRYTCMHTYIYTFGLLGRVFANGLVEQGPIAG